MIFYNQIPKSVIIKLIMDKHTLKVLAFDRVMEMLKEQAASSLGKEAAALTVPTTILEVAKIKQKETKEARDILELEANIPFGGIEDIRPMVEFASVGSMLQPNDLLTILNTLKSSDRLKFYLVKMTEKYPLMGNLASEIVIFKDLETKISSAISLNAEVLDSASQSLANARNELRTTQNRLMERMQSFISSSKYHTYIQEPVITLRSDRYCIPVKAEYKNNIPGIVHDASSSGATLFIEPTVVVELANKRRQLALKEKEEIEKVLTRLSILVGDVCEQIVASMNVVAMLDNITARARLAANMNAVQPIINDTGKVQLYAARHPLIPGKVVPIDISLGKTFNALLITGPNTGGKTVSLKTLGLLSLMAASGLQIPAEPGSEISIFDQIFADVGDEQSIEQSLSTFSSHLKNIIHITERASDKSLVLLDELGAGTDPAEGAALAKAVLDYLLSKGAKIVATTHYGELKEFAYVRDGIQNASVEF